MEKLYFFYKIFCSYLRILFFKVLYGKRFQFNLKKKIYLGKGTNIEIGKNGKLILEGEFTCRNYNNFKVTSGTLRIGNAVFMNNNNSINCRENILIGENVLLGEGIKIYDHDHILKQKELIRNTGFETKKIKIGNNIWICSDCIILKGTVIKNNSIIGAKTLLKNNNIETNLVVFNKNQLVMKNYRT